MAAASINGLRCVIKKLAETVECITFHLSSHGWTESIDYDDLIGEDIHKFARIKVYSESIRKYCVNCKFGKYCVSLIFAFFAATLSV